jgi:antitoxin (DNA-binding transcriptional repressor) of toxin-antitoxin stability system
MYHMKTASIRDLRYDFKKIENLLRQGEEIQITRRRKVIARLVPEQPPAPRVIPDFMGQMREIFGDKMLKVTGAEIVSLDRDED